MKEKIRKVLEKLKQYTEKEKKDSFYDYKKAMVSLAHTEIEKIIKERTKETKNLIEYLSVSPPPLIKDKVGWIWCQAINAFKKELLKRAELEGK